MNRNDNGLNVDPGVIELSKYCLRSEDNQQWLR